MYEESVTTNEVCLDYILAVNYEYRIDRGDLIEGFKKFKGY